MGIWQNSNVWVTNAGVDLLAKLLPADRMEITGMYLANGMVDPVDLPLQTDLTGDRHAVDAGQPLYTAPKTVEITVRANSRDFTASFEAWQVGVFAKDPETGNDVLFLIAQAEAPDTVPGGAGWPEGTTTTLDYRFTVTYGNADGVTVVINPAGLVGQGEFMGHIDDLTENSAGKFALHLTQAERDKIGDSVSKSDFMEHLDDLSQNSLGKLALHMTETERNTIGGLLDKVLFDGGFYLKFGSMVYVYINKSFQTPTGSVAPKVTLPPEIQTPNQNLYIPCTFTTTSSIDAFSPIGYYYPRDGSFKKLNYPPENYGAGTLVPLIVGSPLSVNVTVSGVYSL